MGRHEQGSIRASSDHSPCIITYSCALKRRPSAYRLVVSMCEVSHQKRSHTASAARSGSTRESSRAWYLGGGGGRIGTSGFLVSTRYQLARGCVLGQLVGGRRNTGDAAIRGHLILCRKLQNHVPMTIIVSMMSRGSANAEGAGGRKRKRSCSVSAITT